MGLDGDRRQLDRVSHVCVGDEVTLHFAESTAEDWRGHEIACNGVDVFSIEDGLVARKDSYVDWVARQRQLDALAAMPA
jgi:hypothetical protein